MDEKRHDTGDNNVKQQGPGHPGEPSTSAANENTGRPDKGGTAGQSGGEEAKNRSSNPGSVRVEDAP